MEIAQSLQQTKSSYIREILAAASDKNVISLAGGLPDEKNLPDRLNETDARKPREHARGVSIRRNSRLRTAT